MPTEQDHQRWLAQWLDNVVGKRGYCHVPNGGWRSPVEAAIMKGLGVKAGVPDMLIFAPPPRRPELRGVAVELKRPGGRLTADQASWIDELKCWGWEAFVAFGWDEARERLEELGFGR